MRVLAVETATEACSAALMDGDTLTERSTRAPQSHAALILPMIDSLLGAAGLGLRSLDAIAFGRGPGSFTGVRIATAVVQGLALGASRPVLAVSSLAALADAACARHGPAVCLATLDARMDEIYWARYLADGRGHVTLLGQEQVGTPRFDADALIDVRIGVGSGLLRYAPPLLAVLPTGIAIDAGALPQASAIARIACKMLARGEATTVDAARPVYLRDRVAEPAAARPPAVPAS